MIAIGLALFFAVFSQSILAKSEAKKLSRLLAYSKRSDATTAGLRLDGSVIAGLPVGSPAVMILDGLSRERIFKDGFLFEAAETVEDDLALRTGIINYKVQSRDTLSAISKKFNISIDTIVWANKIDKNKALKKGAEFAILPVSGVLHKISSGETVESIADVYHVPAQQIYSFNKGKFLVEGVSLIVPGGQPVL